jgi:hypothetical protein
MRSLEQSERLSQRNSARITDKRRVFGNPWLVSALKTRLQSSSPAHRLTEAINGGIFPKVPFQQERPT